MRGQNDNLAAIIFIGLIVLGITLIGLSVSGVFSQKPRLIIDPIEGDLVQVTAQPISTPIPTISIATIDADGFPPLPPG